MFQINKINNKKSCLVFRYISSIPEVMEWNCDSNFDFYIYHYLFKIYCAKNVQLSYEYHTFCREQSTNLLQQLQEYMKLIFVSHQEISIGSTYSVGF